MQNWKKKLTRRLLVAVVAVMTVAALATYEFAAAKPARAAAVAPAAAPLDDNSVGALLSLDRAMETLADRGPTAAENVTVTSKPSTQRAGYESAEDMEQFFAPFGGNPFRGTPFGRQFDQPTMPR